MAGLYNGECLLWEWFAVSDYSEGHSEHCTSLTPIVYFKHLYRG